MIYTIITIVLMLLCSDGMVLYYVNINKQIKELRNTQNRLQENIEHKIIMAKIRNKEIKPKHLIEIRECFMDKIDEIL